MIGSVTSIYNALTSKKKAAQSVPASLFFRKDEKNMGIAGLPFDLFISEKHRLSFKVGDHPLQNGTTISDHVHRELQEVTIDGLFTNYSLYSGNTSEDKVVEFGDNYASSDITDVAMENTALKRLESLRELASKKEPVRLVCSLDVYPKMIITDLSYDRDEKSGNAIRFTVTLREIITVDLAKMKDTYRFTPEQIKTANDKMIASEVASGKRSATEAEANEVKKMTAIIDPEVAQ